MDVVVYIIKTITLLGAKDILTVAKQDTKLLQSKNKKIQEQ